MMKRNVFALLAQMGVASVVGITGCAGTLTNDDEILFCQTIRRPA